MSSCLTMRYSLLITDGIDLLIDDGRMRLRVERCGVDFAETRVVIGEILSSHKSINVSGAILNLSSLTE